MKKKLLTAAILTVAAITLVVTSVFITVAYLTSKAEVTNTFTVGNIALQLYESDVNADGQKLDDNPNVHGNMKDSIGNQYHLLPGKTYAKDPTIYLDANSDNAYLFVKVQNDIRDIQAPSSESTPTMREQMEKNNWTLYKEYTDGSVVYVYAKMIDGVLTPTEVNGKTHPSIDTFSQFTVDPDAVVSAYTNAKVIVKAFAIQRTQFEGNIDAAWSALMDAFPSEKGVEKVSE